MMILLRWMAPGMGVAMGLMMIWMLHGALTGTQTKSAAALVIFVAAHAGVALALAGSALWAARFAPRLHARLKRMHRPSKRHLATMLLAALATMGITHLVLHGGL